MYKIYFFVLVAFWVMIFSQTKHKPNVSPLSELNQIETKLTNLLDNKQIDYSNLVIDTYNRYITFNILIDQNISTIIFSTEKDMGIQINALQKLLKTVRINQQKLDVFNVSQHPAYATIKSN